MAKFFRIPVTWMECGVYFVKADTLEQAKDIAQDANLPEGDYLDNSFEIDHESIESFDTEEELREQGWFCVGDDEILK
jgi:hypothetical protein